MIQEDKIAITNQLIGYGVPNSKIWFMGIDEHNGFKDEDLILFQNTAFDSSNELVGSPTYSGYKRILINVFPDLLKDKQYFLTNLYPIGRKNILENYEPRFLQSLGFKGDEQSNEIINKLKNDRFNALQLFLKIFDWENKYIFFCVGINDGIPNSDLLIFLRKMYCKDSVSEIWGNKNSIFTAPLETNKLYTDSDFKKFILPQASRPVHIPDNMLTYISKRILGDLDFEGMK